MKKYPMYTALSQLNEFYGIELSEDTFETYALSAYNKIGNKDYRLYRTKLYPKADPDGGWYVDKPCNMDSIEAITLDYESALSTHATDMNAGARFHNIELDIEATKRHTSGFYLPGKLVKYTELADKIYFNSPYHSVNLLYKGLYLDENGLPYINDKEMDAIVAYCAYVEDLKKARLTKDNSTYLIALAEHQMWQKACANARTPIEISQNQMNEILDVMTSWDRHSYRVSSSKPIV